MVASSFLLLDPLYCQEDNWDVVEEQQEQPALPQDQELELEEEEWAEVILSMLSREEEMRPAADDPYLGAARGEAVAWMERAAAWHGFGALTVLLAVHYIDRCFLARGGALRLQEDKPWMGRLAAVACLSLAAKVEETRVPLLLDLQAAPEDEQTGFLFEAKTIRRMELLVLSALGWRMSPVTPLSFIHHLIPKLLSKEKEKSNPTSNPRDLLKKSQAILLSVMADWRWLCYTPSVWATATLLHAMGMGIGIASIVYEETQNHLLSLVNIPKERVEECSQLILETMAAGNGSGVGNKRKFFSCYSSYYSASPPSPSGVIGSCFSCESSSSSGGDAWATMWPSSVSSSPEHPPGKKPNSIATIFIKTDESEENGDEHLLLV